MAKYLTKVVETYRLANENEVAKFLDELKHDSRFEIAKYSSQKKEKKVKGEIEDEWIRFEVTKIFNDEKEPDSVIEVEYTKENAFDSYEEDIEDED